MGPHLRLCQPVETCHNKTRTETTATDSNLGPKFSSKSALLFISQSSWEPIPPKGRLPTSYKEREAEKAPIVVSFDLSEITPRDHPTPNRGATLGSFQNL